MATSGSYDFSLTGTEIITEALELLGVVGVGKPLTPEDQASCLRTFEMMIKAWQAEGIAMWTTREASLFFSYRGASYSIGPTGDHCSTAGYKTEVATAAASGVSTITVDSDDDITDGDYIGIELDDGTVQWTTVNGTPSSDVVTLTASLTDTVAINNHVYNYTSKIQRPLEIIEVRRISSSETDVPLEIISRDEYMRLSDKDSYGAVNQVYYDPLLTNGKMYVWPTPNDVKEYLKFSCRIPIEDFDSASNDPDFPKEWLMALSWNLAVYVAPKFGKSIDGLFLTNAGTLKQAVKDFDHEDTSIYIRRK